MTAALVTGAGKRIGRAIAIDLAAQGYAVGVHYRGSADAANEVVGTIKASGGRAVALDAELGDSGAVTALVPHAAEALGPLTVLVNNASTFEKDTIETAEPTHWDRQLAVNLRAPFFLTQAFARQLPDGAEGNVINLIDMRVWRLAPDFASYTVSKAGLWTLTQTLAQALAPRIRVNGVGPGPILPSKRQTDAQFRRQWEATPLGHGATPEEIAAAVRFILSARAMTGQMIALDGGQHLAAGGGDE